MKAVYIALGLVAILVAIVLIGGALLPVKHQAIRRAKYNQPMLSLWSALDGPQDWRGVTVETLPDRNGHRMWRETADRNVITYELIENTAPVKRVTRIADQKLPFGGTWTYQLSPTAAGTELRITEDGEVYNPIFRFVSRYIMGHTATIDKTLRALGAKFGETTVVED
jgi:hypothetical protein